MTVNGINFGEIIVIICIVFSFFVILLCIKDLNKLYNSVRVSDLFIDENELVLVYKQKNKIIKKTILKKENIKNFHVEMKVNTHYGRGFTHLECKSNINIEMQNQEEKINFSLCNKGTSLEIQYRFLLQLIKHKCKIPKFSFHVCDFYNSTTNTIYFFQKNGRLPIIMTIKRFFFYLFLIFPSLLFIAVVLFLFITNFLEKIL